MFKKIFSSPKNSGISPYIWTILCILPFYFIFQSSSMIKIIIGVLLTIAFVVFYKIAFVTSGWLIYLWSFLLIGISITITNLFDYVYFAFLLAYLVGNIKERVPFLVTYVVLLVSTTISINLGIILQESFFLKQLPLVIIVWISVILLPFNIYKSKEVGQLEEKLKFANEKIAELIILEERERIARDLHDTLGQKLSLIGLKSDLARRLIIKNPEQAQNELKDVQQTARTALNEVRKMVSSMKGIRLSDELVQVKQLLDAAQIEFSPVDISHLKKVSLLTENILSMCLKEAITNVVKHSGASICSVSIEQTWEEITMTIEDNGIFKEKDASQYKGHGLVGMKERLEFANGSLELDTSNGTKLIIKIPNDVKQTVKGDFE